MSDLSTKKSLPIDPKDLDTFRAQVNILFKANSYAPGAGSYNKIDTLFGVSGLRPVGVDNNDAFNLGEVLLQYMKKFLPNAMTSSPKVSLASYIIQEAATLGLYMNDHQKKVLNIDGENPQSQENYDDKRMSASAIGLFSFASYALYLLQTESKDVEEVNFLKDFGGIPEVQINTYTQASKGAIYYLYKYLTKKDYINSESELLGFLRVYFTELQKLAAEKKDVLKSDDIFFEKNIYQLTGTSFEINGWEIDNAISTATAVFDDQEFDDIVGNARLKNMLRRLVIFLIAYDFEKQKNPFFEFGGGFSTVIFLHGHPGTGKTMFYRALATLLKKICEDFGIPYQILDFPKDMVDSYQGKSAQKVKEWFRAYNDPKKITLGGMDDCENVLVDRGGRNASEGTNGIVAVVLTETEGLQKNNKGSRILLGLTNKIAIIDPAVISRMGIVEEVKGPQSSEDFMDQTYLWMKNMQKLGDSFVLSDPKDYKIMSRQSLQEQKTYRKVQEFVDDKDLMELYTKITAEYKGLDWIGQMCEQFQNRFPNFSGRDVRNIHSAVQLRTMDFDMPENWLTDASVFFKKDYDTKVSMIQNLISENLKHLSFEDLVHEETMNYMNNFVKIGSDDAKKRVDEIVQQKVDYVKANEKFAQEYPEMVSK